MGNNSAVQDCPNKTQPEKKLKSNLKIKCKHRECPIEHLLDTFELVPDNKSPYQEKIEINWDGTNPKPPSEVNVIYRANRKAERLETKVSGPPYVIKIPTTSDKAIYPIEFLPDDVKGWENAFKSWLKENFSQCLEGFYTFNNKREIVVQNLLFGSKKIVVYNPDDWKIKIKFPQFPAFQKKIGTKWDKTLKKEGPTIVEKKWETKEGSLTQTTTKKPKSYTLVETKVEDNLNKKSWQSKTATFVTGGSQTKITNAGDLDLSTFKIEITRNGQPIMVNVFGLVNFIFQVVKWVMALREILKDIPKAGAYLDYELTVCSGDAEIGFGWKENVKDHTAYYDLNVAFNLTIFNGRIELGVGISSWSFKLQIFASGEIDLNLGFSFKKIPNANSLGLISDQYGDREGPFQIPLNLEGTLTVGARAEALYMAKAEATLKTGIKITATATGFGNDIPFTISGNGNFTGVKGKLKTSFQVYGASGFEDFKKEGKVSKTKESIDKFVSMDNERKNVSSETTFIDEYSLFSFQFPKALSPFKNTSTPINKPELTRAIIMMLNGNYLNSGYFNDRIIKIKEYLTTEDVGGDWGSITNTIKYSIIGMDPMKNSDQNEIAELIIKQIEKFPFFDYSAKSLDLFISELRGQLSVILEKQEKVNYIEKFQLIKYLLSPDFVSLCENNTDFEKKMYINNRILLA